MNGEIEMHHPPMRDEIAVFQEGEKSLMPVIPKWELAQNKAKYRPDDYRSLIAKFRSWVYVCANKNATTVAQTRIRLYVRGKVTRERFPTRELEKGEKDYLSKQQQGNAEDVREILEHPLLKLLRLANPHMTGMELLELTELYLELTGNSYWYMERNGLGTPTEIWPLMSQYTWIVPSKTDFVKGYLYGRSMDDPEAKAYTPDQILHFRFPNPTDQWYGLGPLKAALMAVNRAEAQAEYTQAMWDNNARPDFAIKAPIGIQPEQRRRLERSWAAKHRGPKRAGRPIILEGDQDIKLLGWSPKDTGLILAAKFDRNEIGSIFGVPDSMLEKSQSRSETAEHRKSYAENTIRPRLTRLEQIINEELAVLFDERLFIAFDNPVRESRELELKEIDIYSKNGITRRSEIRKRAGYPHDPAFDEPLIPAGMMPVSQIGKQPVQEEQSPKSGRPFRGETISRQAAVDETGAQVVVEASGYLAGTSP